MFACSRVERARGERGSDKDALWPSVHGRDTANDRRAPGGPMRRGVHRERVHAHGRELDVVREITRASREPRRVRRAEIPGGAGGGRRAFRARARCPDADIN